VEEARVPEPIREIEASDGWATGVLLLDDGTLLTTGMEPDVKRWDAETGELLRRFKGHSNAADALAVLPEGDRFVSGSVDGDARVWDLASGDTAHTLAGHTRTVASVAVSPDGDLVATASYDTTARLWDAVSGAETALLKGHAKNVVAVDFGPDGAVLATGGVADELRLWSLPDGGPLGSFPAHDLAVAAVRFLPDGRLVTTGADDTLRVWRGEDVAAADSGIQPVAEAPLGAGGTHALALSPDGTLAAATADRLVVLVAVDDGAVLGTVPFGVKGVYGVSFSGDGSRLATASSDQMVRVWEVADLLG
jgi:WD40 repeat protein